MEIFTEAMEIGMKAILNGQVIAESDDIVECAGYRYFPRAAVRMELLEKAPGRKTISSARRGPVLRRGDRRGAARARRLVLRGAAPRMQQVAGRFGFWQDVEVR